jgi:hypothetical protein
MPALRKLAGTLMLASSATHLTEWLFFEWSLPLFIATLYGVCFLTIGIFLFRPGTRVLWWGAVLPLSAAFLGTANSILQGYIHPITRWHLLVDLIVGPACIVLLRQARAARESAA